MTKQVRVAAKKAWAAQSYRDSNRTQHPKGHKNV